MSELIGIIGGLLIVLAWIWETEEAVRRHKKLIDLKFSAIFLLAAIFLSIYSWQRNDPVFLPLNIAILAIVLVEIWFSLHIKKIHKGR